MHEIQIEVIANGFVVTLPRDVYAVADFDAVVRKQAEISKEVFMQDDLLSKKKVELPVPKIPVQDHKHYFKTFKEVYDFLVFRYDFK